jgi:hypothetical protein
MKRSDAAESHLHKNLEQFAFCPDGQHMCINSDPAHPMRLHLQAPFRDIPTYIFLLCSSMRLFDTNLHGMIKVIIVSRLILLHT